MFEWAHFEWRDSPFQNLQKDEYLLKEDVLYRALVGSGEAGRCRVDENTSLADLRRLVQEEWNAIPQHRVAHLINTMRDRCRQVINRRGGNTPYWSFDNFWNELFLHSKCAHSNIKTAVGFEPRFKCCYDSVIYVCQEPFRLVKSFWKYEIKSKGELIFAELFIFGLQFYTQKPPLQNKKLPPNKNNLLMFYVKSEKFSDLPLMWT